MKTCVTCRWYMEGPDFFGDGCENPNLPLNVSLNRERMIIRGETAKMWASCRVARGYENECGKDGKLWEEKKCEAKTV